MAQAKALDALAPFIVLADTSTSPRQTADVIARATSHPKTFIFAELLQTANVQALASADPEYAAYLTLLRIFSYGTYADYIRGQAPQTTDSTPQNPPQPDATAPASAPAAPLPALDEVQATKLRQLSLVSIATDHGSLTYDNVAAALHLDADHAGTRDETDARLESLVVAAIYEGLLTATLDPAERLVCVTSVAPVRDLVPGSLPALHADLLAWAQRCEATLAGLEAHIVGIHQAAAARAEAAKKWDERVKKAVKAERQSALVRGGPGPAMAERPTQPVRANKRASNDTPADEMDADLAESSLVEGPPQSDSDNDGMDLDP